MNTTIMRYFQTEKCSRFLPSPCAGHVKLAAASIGGGCQSNEMAALLNSLFFAFTNSFLPK